jgi:hypothetical protein
MDRANGNSTLFPAQAVSGGLWLNITFVQTSIQQNSSFHVFVTEKLAIVTEAPVPRIIQPIAFAAYRTATAASFGLAPVATAPLTAFCPPALSYDGIIAAVTNDVSWTEEIVTCGELPAPVASQMNCQNYAVRLVVQTTGNEAVVFNVTRASSSNAVQYDLVPTKVGQRRFMSIDRLLTSSFSLLSQLDKQTCHTKLFKIA